MSEETRNERFKPPPNGWGDDDLTRFIHTATENTYATFERKNPLFQVYVRIDSQFRSLVSARIDEPVPGFLLARTHSALLASIRMAMSGQAIETFVLSRCCLECALYALHCEGRDHVAEVWLRRHEDPDAMRACRAEFTFGKLIETADARLPAAVTRRLKELYQRSIDYGGHPNERAISVSMMVEEDATHKHYAQLYLAGDGALLNFALLSAADAGLTALEILFPAFKKRFELLNIDREMEDIRNHLHGMFEYFKDKTEGRI